MFIPIVNCGTFAGLEPMCWDGEAFETEEECQKWIDENFTNFSMDEIAGCVYPCEVQSAIKTREQIDTEEMLVNSTIVFIYADYIRQNKTLEVTKDEFYGIVHNAFINAVKYTALVRNKKSEDDETEWYDEYINNKILDSLINIAEKTYGFKLKEE